MRIVAFILCILFYVNRGFSQDTLDFEKNKLYYGINAGLNYSKFNSDTNTYLYGTAPAFGFFGKSRITKNLLFKGSVLFSMKSSVSNKHYSKVENQYLDFVFTPQLAVSKDFYINGGLSYSNILSSQRVILDGSRGGGTKRYSIYGFDPELNFVVGVEFKIYKNLNAEINYQLPVKKYNTSTFQFTVNYVFNKNRNASYRRMKRDKSIEQIVQLKEGTLLVRLKTSENTIKSLTDKGKVEKAISVEKEQIAENKKIISSFKKKYNFSKVAFFYSTYSENVKKKQLRGFFLNDSLEIDSTIRIDELKPVFTAEFASLEPDTIKYFSHYTYEPDSELGLKKVANYYAVANDNNNLLALIIKDDKFIQLNKPFPFFVLTRNKSYNKESVEVGNGSGLNLNSMDNEVEALNDHLLNYFYKVRNKSMK